MAEGAIEGTADEYLIQSNFNSKFHSRLPFDINFKYSRFDAVAAPPRKLDGLASGGKCTSVQTRLNLTSVLMGEADGELVPGLNFAGNDMRRQPVWLSNPHACQRACEKNPHCLAFSFIVAANFSDPARRCWMKHRGFERGAFYSEHVVSGVIWRGAVTENRIQKLKRLKVADGAFEDTAW